MHERGLSGGQDIDVDGLQLASKFPIRGASLVGEEIDNQILQAAANSRLELAEAAPN